MKYLLYEQCSISGVYEIACELIYEIDLQVNEMDDLISRFKEELGGRANISTFKEFLDGEKINFTTKGTSGTHIKSQCSSINYYYTNERTDKKYAFYI